MAVEDIRCEWMIVQQSLLAESLTDYQKTAVPIQFYDGTLLPADDSPIRVFGKAIMNIQLRDKHVRHMVLVAQIANEGLIGTDFLRTHGIIINFAKNRVTSEGQTIIAKCQEGQG